MSKRIMLIYKQRLTKLKDTLKVRISSDYDPKAIAAEKDFLETIIKSDLFPQEKFNLCFTPLDCPGSLNDGDHLAMVIVFRHPDDIVQKMLGLLIDICKTKPSLSQRIVKGLMQHIQDEWGPALRIARVHYYGAMRKLIEFLEKLVLSKQVTPQTIFSLLMEQFKRGGGWNLGMLIAWNQDGPTNQAFLSLLVALKKMGLTTNQFAYLFGQQCDNDEGPRKGDNYFNMLRDKHPDVLFELAASGLIETPVLFENLDQAVKFSEVYGAFYKVCSCAYNGNGTEEQAFLKLIDAIVIGFVCNIDELDTRIQTIAKEQNLKSNSLAFMSSLFSIPDDVSMTKPNYQNFCNSLVSVVREYGFKHLRVIAACFKAYHQQSPDTFFPQLQVKADFIANLMRSEKEKLASPNSQNSNQPVEKYSPRHFKNVVDEESDVKLETPRKPITSSSNKENEKQKSTVQNNPEQIKSKIQR